MLQQLYTYHLFVVGPLLVFISYSTHAQDVTVGVFVGVTVFVGVIVGVEDIVGVGVRVGTQSISSSLEQHSNSIIGNIGTDST